jgi:hypothetical protein
MCSRSAGATDARHATHWQHGDGRTDPSPSHLLNNAREGLAQAARAGMEVQEHGLLVTLLQGCCERGSLVNSCLISSSRW